MEHDVLNKTEEPWHNWRTMAGYVYLIICIFDFLVMPAIIQASNADTKEFIIELIKEQTDKEFVLDVTDRASDAHWQPVTLIGGGLFHLSFGAILTGAAVSRGRERTEMVKHNGHNNK